MSAKTHTRINNLSANDASVFINKNEDKQKFSLFDNININNLNNFYNKEESIFKKKVDKLNLRFYLETDKFLNFKHEMEKSQDHLFLLLFKQVSVYVDEIERLNLKVKEREEYEKFHKYKLDEITKRDNVDKEIIYFKTTVRNLEKRVYYNKINEEKLKKENDSYKRQIVFYKDMLKVNLSKKDLGKNSSLLNINSFNNLNNLLTTPTPINRKKINNLSSSLKLNKNENLNLKVNVDKNDLNANYFSIVTLTEDPNNAYINNQANPEDNYFNDNEKNENLNVTTKIKRLASSSMEKNKIVLTDNNLNNSPVKKKRRNISACDGNANNMKITGNILDKKKNMNMTMHITSTTPIHSNISNIKNKNSSVPKNNLRNTTGYYNNINNTMNRNLNKTNNVLENKKKMNLNLLNNVKSKNDNNYQNLYAMNLLNSQENEEGNINLNVNKQELDEFADLFCQNINEELDLLNKEEEILNFLKKDLLLNAWENYKNNDDYDLEEVTDLEYDKTPLLNLNKNSSEINIVNNEKVEKEEKKKSLNNSPNNRNKDSPNLIHRTSKRRSTDGNKNANSNVEKSKLTNPTASMKNITKKTPSNNLITVNKIKSKSTNRSTDIVNKKGL